MSYAPKPKTSSRKSSSSHRSTLSLQKTEIIINVYDLLPPGRISSMLWTLGSSLLHTGVVIKNREYAYGGHDKSGVTGVYWTNPRLEPPGGTFRYELLHGFTFRTPEEIDTIIKEASAKFSGPSYNLLTNNCNHFTAYLCETLTSRPPPRWLNRAASIGVALPCVVPREWLAPPDFETADGALLDDDDDDDMSRHTSRRNSLGSDIDESVGLLRQSFRRENSSFGNLGRRGDRSAPSGSSRASSAGRSPSQQRGLKRMKTLFRDELTDENLSQGGSGSGTPRDSSGREIPPAERAPVPRGRH